MSSARRRRLDHVLRTWAVLSLAFWTGLLAFAAAAATNTHAVTAGADTAAVGDDADQPRLEQRRSQPQTTVDEVSATVMCPTCESTLDDSNSPAADRMRAWVERAVAAGWTEQEIRDGLVEEYGGDESILAVPRASGLGLGIWIAPAIVVLGTLLCAVLVLRRWKRDARSSPARAPAEQPRG